MSTGDDLREVFADVFGVAQDSLSREDSPESIERWDSVGHLNLVMSIESRFDIRFDAGEIPELISFGIIQDRIEQSDKQPG